MNITKLEKIQKDIGYYFKDTDLLSKALTHSSYVNEHRLKRTDCNERIEFLGDAVLELVSSEYLYKQYPTEPEGKLTKMRAKLVCESSLALASSRFGLGSYIRLGKGEDRNGGRERDSIVSDACEALIGAIYTDGGLEYARRFIEHFILEFLIDKQLYMDHKTELQELLQKKGECVPEYKIINESGPQHEKIYSVIVCAEDRQLGEGNGHSKKQAEQAAARNALDKLKNN